MNAPAEPYRPEDDPLRGTRYRATSVLGEGGMGIVWRAIKRETGERVAVKVLHDDFVHEPAYLERFRTEAEVAGLIDHPHVVRVLELRMPPSVPRPYFVMERLYGETVLDRLKRTGALPVDEVVRIALQVLDGLSAVHAMGVVHRDIKPGNVFLCHDSGTVVVKLLDFGIAKLLPEEERAPQLTPHSFETGEGTFLGTALYASPEQARGEEVDRRTDVFAVGHVLYNMLTGRSPYGRVKETDALLRLQQTKTPPPPSDLARSPVPPELDELVMAALAKPAEDRFASAEAFAEALEDVAGNLARPAGWLATQFFDPRRVDQAQEAERKSQPQKARTKQRAHRHPRRRKRQRRPLALVAIAFVVGCAVAVAILIVARCG